eukprot:5291817-Amphidinium_carterae.1
MFVRRFLGVPTDKRHIRKNDLQSFDTYRTYGIDIATIIVNVATEAARQSEHCSFRALFKQ